MEICRLCDSSELLRLLDLGAHPIAHRLLSDPLEREYTHPTVVGFCNACGLVQLIDPVPVQILYSHYHWLSSWKPQPHMPHLVRLIDRLPGLQPTSTIVEVGSNDGTFLEMLRASGYRSLLGVEPALDAQEAASQRGIDTLGRFFDPETAQEIASARGRCGLLVARQVLEHVTDLAGFRQAVRILLEPGGYVLFEVPNLAFTVSASDYSAIWEEHVNYFTLMTLRRYLADFGIQVIHEETASFCGEALIVLGKRVEDDKVERPNTCLDYPRARILGYRDRWPGFRKALVGYLSEQREEGRKLCVYGAGCRACSLVNLAGLSPFLEFVVDDQAEKQGKYMPGSRLPILPGEVLEKAPIDLCLLAVNAENESKVITKHRVYQANGGKFASLHPPSERLLPFWSDYTDFGKSQDDRRCKPA